LGEVLSAGTTPAAALSLEATADSHFDVLFINFAAGTHRCKTATERAAQPRRNSMPIVDPVAVA
jgi:hypothetical protein